MRWPQHGGVAVRVIFDELLSLDTTCSGRGIDLHPKVMSSTLWRMTGRLVVGRVPLPLVGSIAAAMGATRRGDDGGGARRSGYTGSRVWSQDRRYGRGTRRDCKSCAIPGRRDFARGGRAAACAPEVDLVGSPRAAPSTSAGEDILVFFVYTGMYPFADLDWRGLRIWRLWTWRGAR